MPFAAHIGRVNEIGIITGAAIHITAGSGLSCTHRQNIVTTETIAVVDRTGANASVGVVIATKTGVRHGLRRVQDLATEGWQIKAILRQPTIPGAALGTS